MESILKNILPVVATVLSVFIFSGYSYAKEKNRTIESFLESRHLINAIDALERGENDACESFLDEELKDNPGNGIAYLYMADVKFRKRDLRSALLSVLTSKDLLKGIKDKIIMAYANFLEGSILMDIGERAYDEGIKSIRMAVKADPENVDYRNALYLSQIQAKDFKGAESTMKDFEKRFPDSPQLYFCKGKKSLIDSDYVKAMEYFEKAVEKDPEYEDGYIGRGICRLNLGQDKDGFDDLFKYASKGNSIALGYLYRLDKSHIPELERYVSAKELKERADWIYPDLLGYVYMENRMYAKAIDEFKKELMLDPNPSIYESLYYCSYSLGDVASALENIDWVIALSPDDASAEEKKSGVYALTRDFKNAVECMDKAIRKNGDEPYSYYSRGNYKASAGDYEGAMQDFEKALGILNESPRFIYARGLTLLNNGDKTSAEADFRKVVSLYDEGIDNYNAASAMARLGMKDRALEVVAKAIAENPDDSDVYFNAAAVNAILENTSEAVANLYMSFHKKNPTAAFALSDRDFDNIRDTPAFRNLFATEMPLLPKE